MTEQTAVEPQPQRLVDTQSVHVTCTHVCPIIAPSINGVQSVQSIIASLGIVPLEVNTKEVPAGRLKHFLSNWEHLTRDRWILNTVGGYQIEFSPEPSQFRKPYSPHFSQVQDQLIREEVGELQRKGAVTEVTAPMEGGFYSTLFLVPKKDGGQRPVINLKALNEFVVAPHFKMEGIHTLKNLLKPGDWLAKVDLKDAYFSIPIHPDHRKYLRFPLGERVYQFTCLPFGLASAPWVFTKTLRPIAALARELGLRVVFYIDDILLMAESKEKLRDQAAGLVYLLQCLGFTINTEKTTLSPTQSLVFLGFTVNTTSMELSLPPEKLKKIRAEARKLLGAEPIPARSLARLVGKMNATTEVIPPAPLFFRHLQMDLSAALRAAEQDYETEVRLSPGSREELTWWDTHMVRWNGRSMLIKDQDLTIDLDASILGWGTSCQGLSTGGSWSAREKTRHINCLELLAATLALKTFAKKKTGLSVLLRIDNMTAVAYINNQGGNGVRESSSPDPRPVDVVSG